MLDATSAPFHVSTSTLSCTVEPFVPSTLQRVSEQFAAEYLEFWDAEPSESFYPSDTKHYSLSISAKPYIPVCQSGTSTNSCFSKSEFLCNIQPFVSMSNSSDQVTSETDSIHSQPVWNSETFVPKLCSLKGTFNFYDRPVFSI